MSHYFLCSQNKDSINHRFIQIMVSDFVVAEFPKTPSPKPARIHSPDPFLRAGNSVSVLPNPNPQKNSFGKTESALKPHALPEYLEGRTPKEKHPFLFQKKFHPRQIRNARSVFSFGVAGVLASARGFLRIICFESRFELGTINTQFITWNITQRNTII